MSKFKELQLEETRVVGDGARPATLMNVTGSTGVAAGAGALGPFGPYKGFWVPPASKVVGPPNAPLAPVGSGGIPKKIGPGGLPIFMEGGLSTVAVEDMNIGTINRGPFSLEQIPHRYSGVTTTDITSGGRA